MRSSTSSSISSGNNLLLLAVIALIAAFGIACGDDENGGGGIVTSENANFSATPNPVTFPQVEIGSTSVQVVTIQNTGRGELQVRNIELHNTMGEAFALGEDWPTEITLGESESESFTVEYNPYDQMDFDGHITMNTNASGYSTAQIDFEVAGFEPELFIDPPFVDFPQTPPNSETWRVVQIFNIGAGTLHFDDIFLAGEHATNFSYSVIPSRNQDGGFPPRANDVDEFPDSLEPGDDPIYLRVIFSPEDELPKNAHIHLASNDQDATIDLNGNSGDACLEVVQGDSIDFGPASMTNTTYLTVTLRNCSPSIDAQLELGNIEISDDGGGVFALQPNSLPGNLPDEIFTLNAGDVTTVVIGYSPTDEVDDLGELRIESNDARNPDLRVPITGTGVDADCPVAVAGGSVGGVGGASNPVFATNQDVVHLSSEGSTADGGGPLTYEWTVIANPDGSLSDVEPSPSDPNPTFDVDIVGHFQIELVVYDEHGLRNCEPAIVEIDAAPDEDIHIQLLWTIPEVEAAYGGPNGAAGIGTDLDIHYVNTAAQDEWGATDSIFWRYTSQNWGAHGQARLDIDDYYGENPENINHSDPGMGGVYRLGVHYFDDKGYGASDATIRIYFGTTLYGQWNKRLEQTDNFWYVGNVHWTESPYVNLLDNVQPTHSLLSANGT